MTKSLIKPYRGRKGITSGKTKTGVITSDSKEEGDDNLPSDLQQAEGEAEGQGEGEPQEGEQKEGEGKEGEGEGEVSPIYAQKEGEGEGEGESDKPKPLKIAFDITGTLVIKSSTKNLIPNYKMVKMLEFFVENGDEVHVWSSKGIKYAIEWAESLGIDEMVKVIAKNVGSEIDVTFDDEKVVLGKLNILVKC